MFASAYKQLTPAERSFVDAVVVEMERAADRANERVSNALYRPLPEEIRERSHGMLERPMVTAAITERINEISAAQDLTIARVVKELMASAFSNMGNYMTLDDEGAPVFSLSHCTPEQLAAIKSIDLEEVGDGITKPIKRKWKVTLHEKLPAMKMLAEYMGMLQPDNPHWRVQIDNMNMLQLQAGATPQQAGEEYAKYLDG